MVCPALVFGVVYVASSEAMILFLFPSSEVSLGYGLQPPPLGLLGFPPFFLQLLVPPLWDLQQVPSSIFGIAFPPDFVWFVSGRGRLGHPHFGDAEPRPDAAPPQHHVHGQQAGSPQLQGFIISHYAQAGAPKSRHQALGLKAGPAVLGVLCHHCDPGVLKEFEVAVHSVGVDRAELFGALLADDLRNCIAPFPYTWGAVGTDL